MGAVWVKCRQACGVLYDKRVPNHLKEQIYEDVIKLAMLYGVQCWTIKKKEEDKVKVNAYAISDEWFNSKKLSEKLLN